MSSRNPIMVMAGGTGGHVFPALAVAHYLRQQGEEIVWMGTRSGIEARLVPEANFPIEWLKVQGLRGKGLMVTALAPFKLLQACWQAMHIIRRHKPIAVLGMGGFASGPGGLMAWLMRIPLVIHEQNAVMGFTNRILSRIARISYFAFPQAAQGMKRAMVTGNPVRPDIVNLPVPEIRMQQHSADDPINLLVIGGSLGARTLNEVLPQALVEIEATRRPRVRHQCGEQHLQACRNRYAGLGIDAEVLAFIDDMPEAYAWADLVVCRAGALTVAELAAAGLASILVPYPHAVDDHQYFNAAFLSDVGAAERIRDHEFTAGWLAEQLMRFNANRQALVDMACKARAVAYTQAVQLVADGLLREVR